MTGKKPSPNAMRVRTVAALIPMAISVRHVHLTQNTINQLFGPGHVLHIRSLLSQPGQYAAEETVTLVGPRGRLPHVRVVGPPRPEDQVELSLTDEMELGVDAPVRESGDLKNTPGVVVEGPEGAVNLRYGVICPLRHIHMSPADADVLGLKNHDRVSVVVTAGARRLTFRDIVVRVSPAFILELHLDTDEGNATGLRSGADVLLAEIGK
jgi:acetate kinase